MNLRRTLLVSTIATIAAWVGLPARAALIPVEDWVVHNSAGAINVAGADTDSPTFTAADLTADQTTAMAAFSPITLANAGDYLTLSTTLTMSGRTTTGAAQLNTQLRFGLFNGPAGAVVPADQPNPGVVAQYARSAQGHLKVFEQSSANVDPFMGMTEIGNVGGGQVVADPEDDAIAGATAVANYLMTITRTAAGNLNITGQISGGNYLSTFAMNEYNSAAFPTGGPFTFNRVGFFLGNNVNAVDGSAFADVTIETNVPEPATTLLAAAGAALLIIQGRRRG